MDARSIGFSVLFATAIAACGGGGGPTGPGGRTPDFSDARAWVSDSPVAEVLVACVDFDREPASCSIGKLPPVGLDVGIPSVEALLERLVVSHDWMGERFAEIAADFPDDLLSVLGSTTAIVIDADVRPSFYSAATGAIYIDPAYLWLTPEEEETISDEADYRSGFGNDLLFVPFSNYLDGEDLAFSRGGADSRTFLQRSRAVSALLFHEGAHARDFMPLQAMDELDSGQTFMDEVERFADRRPSMRLAREFPLDSEVWSGLADVLYRGKSANGQQRSLDAAAAGRAFEEDSANDPYAYSTVEEDLAMLFEATMLRRNLDLVRRVGMATKPEGESTSCADYRVGWGVHNRLGTPSVRARAQRAAELILGRSLNDFFESLPLATPMEPGGNLCLQRSSTVASILGWM